MDMKALAAERLARRASRSAVKPEKARSRISALYDDSTTTSRLSSHVRSVLDPPSATASRTSARGRRSQSTNQLVVAHRSIRLAHSFGCAACILALLLLVIWSSLRWGCVLSVAGVALARYGGAWLHRIMPVMWKEGTEPSPKEVSDAADLGVFSLEGVKNLGESLRLENQVALENLAFLCTYGKKNCLTQAMYSGPLSYGKVLSLVWSKLSGGTVRCL